MALVRVLSRGVTKKKNIRKPPGYTMETSQEASAGLHDNPFFSATGILIFCKNFISSWCRVSLIFVRVFYTSLNSRAYKIKLKSNHFIYCLLD